MKPIRIFRLPILFVVLLLPAASALSQQSGPAISNNYLTLRFDSASGALVGLTDVRSGHDFVGLDASDGGLWEIDLMPGSVPSILRPLDANSFRWEHVGGTGRGLRLIWSDFAPLEYSRVQVIATVSLDDSGPLSRWTIRIEGPEAIVLEKLRYPRVLSINEQPDERLAAPVWMGQIGIDPRAIIARRSAGARRLEWPYPGTLSLQCLALYRDNGPGLYFSCDDTAAYRKTFALWGDDQRNIHYEMGHYPEDRETPQKEYQPAYAAIVGTFNGDWITAAERYREWGTRQRWAQESRLNRGLVPTWLLETGMWVWNRGRSDQVLSPAREFRKELGLPVSVFWHWWHGCPYDVGFPEYFPPREGTESFATAVREAQQEGITSIVYMNQRLWGMTTKSWEEKGAERFAVKMIDGSVRPEIYNTFTNQACASMCLATSFWRDTYASLAERAVRELGVDGIYMDQACSSLLCYDPNHGHPLGGGTFWMNGFRLLSTDIRNRTRDVRNVLLAGEGSGEAWLPYLDLMLTLQVSRERYAAPADGWEVIPFFQAVYHPYGITYGNYSSLTMPPYDELWPPGFAPKEPLKLLDRTFSLQFFLEQARAFVWGVQPTIANFLPSHLQERREEVSYVIKLARTRARALEYLQHGTFLRSPSLTVPAVNVPLLRLSIYAGQKETENTWERTFPSVITGTWRSVRGTVAIAIASIADRTVPLSMTFAAGDYDLPTRGQCYRINDRGKELIGSYDSGRVEINLNIPPRGAFLIELTP